MIDTMIFSATAGRDIDTLLWQTSENSSVIFKQNNKDSLQKIYNKAIDFALQEHVQNLVLVHDDVILENFSEERLNRLFKKFDVVGCAGTTEVSLKAPALWHLMGGGFKFLGDGSTIKSSYPQDTSTWSCERSTGKGQWACYARCCDFN